MPPLRLRRPVRPSSPRPSPSLPYVLKRMYLTAELCRFFEPLCRRRRFHLACELTLQSFEVAGKELADMFDSLRVLAFVHLTRTNSRTQSYLPVETGFSGRGRACVSERKNTPHYFECFLQLTSMREGAKSSFQVPVLGFQAIKQFAAADEEDARKIFLSDDHIIPALVIFLINVVRWLMLLDELSFEY